MTTAEERLTVLKMLEAGTINTDEARSLLAALAGGRKSAQTAPGREARSLRVRLRDAATGREKHLVTVPLPVLDIALRWGTDLVSRLPNEQLQAVLIAVRVGRAGRVLDFFDEVSGDRVEVFIE